MDHQSLLGAFLSGLVPLVLLGLLAVVADWQRFREWVTTFTREIRELP